MKIIRKTLLAAALLLLNAPFLHADSGKVWWCLDQNGLYTRLSDVVCLLDDAQTASFSLLLTDGKVISGIKELTFQYIPDPSADVQTVGNDRKAAVIVVGDVVEITRVGSGTGKAEVISMNGEVLLTCTLKAANETVDIKAMAAGCYLLRVDGVTTKICKR